MAVRPLHMGHCIFRSTFHNRITTEERSHHANVYFGDVCCDHPCLTGAPVQLQVMSFPNLCHWQSPLELSTCGWTALATQICPFFSRSLCLFFFTLILYGLSHATSRSKARGNGNPSWRWGYNLWRSPHDVGGGEWSPPSFTEVILFQRQYCTHKSLMEMQWFPLCAMKMVFYANQRLTDIWGVLVFF